MDVAVLNLEDQHPGEPTWLWRLGNLTAIDSDWVSSIGIAWLFKEGDQWRFLPRITGNDSLFYNAVLFLRLSLPFGVFFGCRLSSNYLFQCGLGWKLNGRIALLFRVQTDESAAKGVSGPNFGQARGFDYGTH